MAHYNNAASNEERIAECIQYELDHEGNSLTAAKAVLQDIARGRIRLLTLPLITQKMRDMFDDTCLMETKGWTQTAVDFVCLLQSELYND